MQSVLVLVLGLVVGALSGVIGIGGGVLIVPALIDSIDVTSLPGLRDRALIGLMVYTFARVGAAISMKVEDFYVQGRRGWSGFMRRAARNTRCQRTTISTAT